MNPVDLIAKKRAGETLTDDEIRWWIHAYTAADVPDYQMAAMAMAICFQGLSPHETSVWTAAMRDSGEPISFAGAPGFRIDKHSTGGVGDKISIPLAPIVAALGLQVPMISGRGLGLTGGTLDKLESIPGYRTDLSLGAFQADGVDHRVLDYWANRPARTGRPQALCSARRDRDGELDPIDRRLHSVEETERGARRLGPRCQVRRRRLHG